MSGEIKTDTFKPGDRVAYVPRVGPVELGIVSSTYDRWVFVNYDGYSNNKATDPADLRLVVRR